jgi:ATP-dependent DNA helicase RecG
MTMNGKHDGFTLADFRASAKSALMKRGQAEAITNAACHRDYADSGNVLVKFFDDRLEIWNPGSLPPGLTVDDLRKSHESKPRNKLIARAFFLIKYIEQIGTGTGRMITDCREAGVPESEFESRASSFRIVFRKPVPVEEKLAGLQLNARQIKGIHAAIQIGKITRRDYATLTATTPATAKRDLAELVAKKILEPRGRGRSVSYILSAQIMSRK